MSASAIQSGIDRRIVVIDLENIVGEPRFTTAGVIGAMEMVEQAVGPLSDDQVIIGLNVTNLAKLLGVPLSFSPRFVIGTGEGAADLALTDVLESEDIEERYSQVILMTGDHIFADTVGWLGSAGVAVDVFANVGECSKALQFAARSTTLMNKHNTEKKAA